MAIEVLTRQDLDHFRVQLLREIIEVLQPQREKEKKWLRSSEVRKLLHISAGTLQNFRVKGWLHPAKIGGIHYYEVSEIESLLKEKK